jgi:FkbM family methyltransferase
MNLETVTDLARRSGAGIGLRNRMLASLCAARATMGERRRWMRRLFERLISAFSSGGIIRLELMGRSAEMCLLLREGNVADYLVAGERVKGSYQIPANAFAHPPCRIVDGGANIGTFAIYAASIFPGVPVVCYEPESGNAGLLRTALAANRIAADVVEKGLWSREGRLFFHPAQSYAGSVSEAPSEYPIETVKVDAPDGCWLKLDIEGAEYEVLPQLIEAGNRPRVISLEVHDVNRRGHALLEVLKKAGYEIHGGWGAADTCAEITAVLRSHSK